MFMKLFMWIFLLVCLVLLSIFDINKYTEWMLIKNLMSVSSVLFGLLPLIMISAIVFGFLNKKWAIRIERLNIGGFNVLLDNPDDLYKRSVNSFLDTKRTLFKIDEERDNFNEVLNSYFLTYEFFRNEMKILKKKKNKENEMYSLTNNAIKVLNEFLTNHQSDFRRWYKYVSENNEVECIEEEGKTIKFHLNSIGKIQRNYYRYDDICSDLKKVNEFFNGKISDAFDVDKEKWEVVSSSVLIPNIHQERAV